MVHAHIPGMWNAHAARSFGDEPPRKPGRNSINTYEALVDIPKRNSFSVISIVEICVVRALI